MGGWFDPFSSKNHEEATSFVKGSVNIVGNGGVSHGGCCLKALGAYTMMLFEKWGYYDRYPGKARNRFVSTGICLAIGGRGNSDHSGIYVSQDVLACPLARE